MRGRLRATTVAVAVLLVAMGILAVVVAGSTLDGALYEGSDSQAFLPVVMQPLPTPSTPPISVQRYRMEYAIQTAEQYVWMPAPRYWDGNGVRQLSILQVSPAPKDRFREKNGTEIVYWENPAQITQTFKVVFDTEIGLLEYGIDENRQWVPYDALSDLYQKNTAATIHTQVDHPEIQSQAKLIIGDEANPYHKAKLIHRWVAQNIGEGDGPEDALSTLRRGTAACGGHANLFTALCRASGVPARNVSGMHNPRGTLFQSGSLLDGTLGFHVWSEFYLPDYGWVQVEPSVDAMFTQIDRARLPTSKGNDIHLGNGHAWDELFWFHVPWHRTSQLEHSPVWLTVTRLP